MVHFITFHGLVVVIGLLIYVITAHLLGQRRQPSAAIAWVLFIVLLPYVAVPLFLSFGSRKLARPRAVPGQAPPPAGEGDADGLQRTLRALGQPAPAAYHGLSVHADGREALQALWQHLEMARESIDICTFILDRSPFGQKLIDALCAKARAGVRVRLLLDGLGSLMQGRPDFRSLKAAGAEVLLFVPPLHSPLKGRTNLRNHRKLLVVDAAREARRLWCGGRNLAPEYFEGRAGQAPWHDLSFELGGPLVLQAHTLFEHDWAFASTERSVAPAPTAEAFAPGGAQLVASGPDQVDDTVYALLLSAIYRARERIVLVTPYFVPDAALVMALSLAARRGVAVELLMPARSNHRLSDFARGRAARQLAQAGARLQLAPQMLHAKLVIVDDSLALAGSLNLDSRSLFLNYELMLAFHAPRDVQRFSDWYGAERASAQAFEARPPGLLRDLAEGMVLWLAFQL